MSFVFEYEFFEVFPMSSNSDFFIGSKLGTDMLINDNFESVLIVSSLVIFNNLYTAPDTDPLEEIDHVDMEQELGSKEVDQDQ